MVRVFIAITFLIFHLPVAGQQLSFALDQINAQIFIDQGLTGKGVKIGIIDGGFLNANKSRSLKSHFDDDRVKYYKDFAMPDLEPYRGSRTLDDGHGTAVWSNIGGFNPNTNTQFGLATKSTYYIARTDHPVSESRKEERDMILAMDEMIKQGVKLFNISLGYTNEYTRKSEDYVPDQIDGMSTWITRSMDSLLSIHNVLVIVSAGNDGDSKWQTLSAPADSKNVLSVGASKLNGLEAMFYSSTGPEKLDYVKPDVSCFATNGTSFSAPIITGLAACLMEFDSTLSPQEIKQIIVQSGSLYLSPNNHLGNGVPNAQVIMDILQKDFTLNKKIIGTTQNSTFIDLSGGKQKVILYHKSDGWKVRSKQILKAKRRLRIKRSDGCDRTTVLIKGEKPIEIRWKS